MPETYFKNFNVIQYGNTVSNNAVIDITQRVVALKNNTKNPNIYYPTDITDGVRPDQVAQLNFNDAYSSWLLYLTNDITDPYYEWYLTPDQFAEYITTKYGSVSNAQQTIALWRNNWVDQPSLSSSAYNAEIAGNPEKIKYWTPNLAPTGFVIDYSRAQQDWTTSTNQIVQYTYTGSGSFVVNELLNVNGTGRAQVVQSNSTTVVAQHTVNNVAVSSGYLYGATSQSNVTITAFSYLANTISSDEIAYWTPVSYYDLEEEKNEGNRTILVMNQSFVPTFINNVKTLLSNT